MAGLRAPRWWSARGAVALAWLPLAVLFSFVVQCRRLAYRMGWLRSHTLPVPVVVVGNLVAGGSGKTPATLWLVAALQRAGWRPGILSRGYGGRVQGTRLLGAERDPALVGDEPVLMAQRSGVPVCVGRDRVAAGRALLAAHPEVNVLLTDDGLQHYRLARMAEVVVIDEAVLGNRLPLPAGPLREPLARATEASLVLAHGELSAHVRAAVAPCPIFPMRLEAGACYRLAAPGELRPVAAFKGLRVRALAGIGRPARFFETLRQQGLELAEASAFPDHHAFTQADLKLAGCDVLLMTEKDAIKCMSFAPAETWVLPVSAEIPDGALTPILERLHGRQTA